jgi:hypothetical protein
MSLRAEPLMYLPLCASNALLPQLVHHMYGSKKNFLALQICCEAGNLYNCFITNDRHAGACVVKLNQLNTQIRASFFRFVFIHVWSEDPDARFDSYRYQANSLR